MKPTNHPSLKVPMFAERDLKIIKDIIKDNELISWLSYVFPVVKSLDAEISEQ